MRNYQVTLHNDTVHTVTATHYQPTGGNGATFYRRHPSSPEEGSPYNPEAPYFEPLQVATFIQIQSVILIEEE